MEMLKSIIQLKCPKCRKGKLFKNSGLIVFKKPLNMYSSCQNCNLKYEIEPGFWIGALWASYPIIVFIEFPFLMLALFSKTMSPWFYFGLMLIAFFLTWSLMLRLGRSIWIHLWVKYKADL